MRLQVGIKAGSERWLFAVVGVLVGIDVLMTVVQFTGAFPLPESAVRLLDLAEEGSIPTWYSSVQLLFAAILLGAIATRKFALRDPHRLAWAALSIGFALLSLDETASLHEESGLLLRGVVSREGIFYFRWTVIALACLPVLLVVFWRFLNSLPLRTRLELIAAAAVFLVGAVGLELVTGLLASQGGQRSVAYALFNALENGLELLGIALLIGTLLRHEREGPATASITILLHEHSLARFLLAAVGVLVSIGVVLSLLASRGADLPSIMSRSFDLLQERNIPTWFTSMFLAVSAGLCTVLARATRTISREAAIGWLVLACVLLLHSADEVAELHEMAAAWLQLNASAGGSYSWPSLAILLVAAPMASARPWLRRQPDHLRRALCIAAVTFYIGALVVPIISTIVQAAGITGGVGILGVAGEGLEMAAAAYLVSDLARHASAPAERR